MWVLIVCIGITWAGCGSAPRAAFPSKEDCFEALSKIKIETPPGGKGVTAVCLPKSGIE